MSRKFINAVLALVFYTLGGQNVFAQDTVIPTPTAQSQFLQVSPIRIPTTDESPVFTQNNASSADQIIDNLQESLLVPFTVPGHVGVNTAQEYSGEVTDTISDGGQSAGIALNDAFYLYIDQYGHDIVPQHLHPFYLFIDNAPAIETIGFLPDYRQDHVYSFKLNLGNTPRHINFAIGDTYTLDNEGSFTVVISESDSAVLVDSDKDGIWDHWETEGAGIDTNGDGKIDLDLYALGARPDRQDIFLEIDWLDGRSTIAPLHSHKPNQESIDIVVKAFNKHNITLHVELSEIGIPETDDNRIISYCGSLPTSPCPPGAADFDIIKDKYFGNPVDSQAVKDAKALVFHYALFVHHIDVSEEPPSGIAELKGNDLMVGVGCFTDIACRSNYFLPKTRVEAGTLMHELGHNLGLRHGGVDDYNYKPNYISVMNYLFQMHGIKSLVGEIRYDYSNEQLDDLDEYHLRESNGIGNATDQTYYTCNSPNGHWFEHAQTNIRGPVPGNEAIDWNCFVDPIPDISTNINKVNEYFANGQLRRTKYDDTLEDVGGDQVGDTTDGLITLKGHDDWANLELNFRNDWDWLEGYHIGTLSEPELDAETAKLIMSSTSISPAADPGGPYNIDEGDLLLFDASNSTDPNGDDLAYKWDFGDGSVGVGITTTHIYLDNGNYRVTLTVTNTIQLSNTQATIAAVDNVSPTVAASMNLTVTESDTVSFTVGFTDPGSFDTHTASINWGDRIEEPGLVRQRDDKSTVMGSHIFADSGIYTVEICVTDDDGGIGCNFFVALVEEAQHLLYMPVIVR